MSVTYREVIMQMATPIYQENPNIRDLEFSTLFHRIGSRNPRVAKWPEKVTIKEADPKVLEIARRSLGGRMGSTEARNQSSLSDHLKNRDFEKALEAIVHLPYKQKDAARVELAQLAVDAHKDTLAKDLLAQSVDASLLKSQLLVQLGVVNGDPKTHYYNELAHYYTASTLEKLIPDCHCPTKKSVYEAHLAKRRRESAT